RDHFGIDLHRLHLLRAVDDDGHHAAARVAFDAQFGHLPLQALLHLLRLLHHLLHLLDVHISSTSRISAGNTSSIVCTPASASALSRKAVFLSAAFASAAGAASACGGCAAPPASICTAAIVILRPATCCASDSSHARFCSTMLSSVFWFGENVKTTRSPDTSIFCACATTVL